MESGSLDDEKELSHYLAVRKRLSGHCLKRASDAFTCAQKIEQRIQHAIFPPPEFLDEDKLQSLSQDFKVGKDEQRLINTQDLLTRRASKRVRKATTALFTQITDHTECLDVDNYRRQYQAISTRMHQNHVNEAHKVYEAARRQELQKRAGMKKKRGEGKSLGRPQISESLEVLHETSQPWRPIKETEDKKEDKVQCTEVMKRLALAKDNLFTGTEAGALKKLLCTLRWKTWTPELYFHIRFFSVRHKLHPMSAETKALVKKRWHFILRMLRTLHKIISVLAARCYDKTLDCVAILDMVNASFKPICYRMDPNLAFDRHNFKIEAKSHTMMSIDAQDILTQVHPEDRTAENIEQVVLSLQYVNDFAQIPAELQHRLVERAHYARVGSNRVILRQGHIPQYYYFVLLGEAVSKRVLDNGKSETTGILRKGDGFGGVAIFSRCRRLTTVVSRTPLYLLVVPKSVILLHFGKNIKDYAADTIGFLKKMWFMQSWPLEHLYQCPHQCKWRKFRRTEIIEADATKSEWIYVVVEGTFRVYQRHPLYNRRVPSISVPHSMLSAGSRSTPQSTQQSHSPYSSTPWNKSNSQNQAAEHSKEQGKVPNIVLGKHTERSESSSAGKSPAHAETDVGSATSKDRFLSVYSETESGSERSTVSTIDGKPFDLEEPETSGATCTSVGNKLSLLLTVSKILEEGGTSQGSAPDQRSLLHAPEFAVLHEPGSQSVDLKLHKMDGAWLQNFDYKLVDTLHHFDVFGLEDMCLHPHHPPPKRHLLAISDGVECVMISKNFYLQMANPRLRKKVHARLKKRRLACTQISAKDCSLIPLGGIERNPALLLDPINPKICIHC